MWSTLDCADETGVRKLRQHRVYRGKYWGRSLNSDEVRSTLMDFVRCPSTNRVRVSVVRRFVSELSGLASAMRNTNWRWWSTSILLAYDAAGDFTNDDCAAIVRLIARRSVRTMCCAYPADEAVSTDQSF